MMRFSYLVPRLIILALIALATWVGSDPLIRRFVVRNMENATGAVVEIGKIRASLTKQKLFVKELAIADPQDPMKNLFQADMAYVEFDPKSLLARRIVIESGQTSKAVFGAPRTSSGALEHKKRNPLAVANPGEKRSWQPKPIQSIEQIGLSWIDQLPASEQTSIAKSDSLLAETAKQYQQFWSNELATQNQNILALKARMESLKTVAQPNLDNPLRKPKFDSSHVFVEVQTGTKAIEARLTELQQAVTTNRQSLQQAYERDLLNLRLTKRNSNFDSDTITRLLLTESEEKNINEILGWFHWFRETLPDPRSDFSPKAKRGLDIELPTGIRKPEFLIKSIDLEGEGRFANQHNTFAGTAYNLTSEPELLDEPTSFELRAQGEFHVIVKCTLDRRKQKSIDSLKLICPDLELDSQLLGEANSMLVTLGPESRIQADIDIQVIDDQLSGELVFRHSNVSLHVDKLNSLAGGENTALKMNQGLSSVNQFVSRIRLSGTLDDYQYRLQSDLGTQFANAVDTILSETNQKEVVERRQKLDALLKQQLTELDETVEPGIQRLIQSLNDEAYKVADLRKQFPDRSSTSDSGSKRIPNLHFRR